MVTPGCGLLIICDTEQICHNLPPTAKALAPKALVVLGRLAEHHGLQKTIPRPVENVQLVNQLNGFYSSFVFPTFQTIETPAPPLATTPPLANAPHTPSQDTTPCGHNVLWEAVLSCLEDITGHLLDLLLFDENINVI